jgi:GNAT superfamily N-acetyltransferase
MSQDQWTVSVVSTADILDLRMSVLRDGTPSKDPRYPQDDDPDAVHFGIFDADTLIATSTWLDRPWPHEESHFAVQLRGMAVAKTHQSRGIGGILLGAGIDRARDRGARFVWARARDRALNFYEQHGFAIVGDQFIDDASGLGHHLVVIELPATR